MKDRKELAQQWLEVARNDLLFAKAGFKDTQYWAGVCFACHQVAEKSLKAMLILHDKQPERIHNLSKLFYSCLEFASRLASIEEACLKLNAYYAPARYPDMGAIESYSSKDAQAALEYAEQILALIKIIIS